MAVTQNYERSPAIWLKYRRGGSYFHHITALHRLARFEVCHGFKQRH